MKEIIIIETNKPQKLKNFLNKEHFSYRVYQEPINKQKTDIFAKYDQAIKDKEREKELKLWDNADLDEQLNTDGEWWS